MFACGYKSSKSTSNVCQGISPVNVRLFVWISFVVNASSLNLYVRGQTTHADLCLREEKNGEISRGSIQLWPTKRRKRFLSKRRIFPFTPFSLSVRWCTRRKDRARRTMLKSREKRRRLWVMAHSRHVFQVKIMTVHPVPYVFLWVQESYTRKIHPKSLFGQLPTLSYFTGFNAPPNLLHALRLSMYFLSRFTTISQLLSHPALIPSVLYFHWRQSAFA